MAKAASKKKRAAPTKKPVAARPKAKAAKAAKPKAKPLEPFIAAANLAVLGGKLDEACAALRDARAHARSVAKRTQLRTAWHSAAQRFLWKHEWDKAAVFYAGGVEVFREGDDTTTHAQMLNDLGYSLHQLGKLDEAEAASTQALALQTAADRKDGVAAAHYHLSGIAFERGQIDKAVEIARKAVAISRETGNQNDEAYHMYALARSLYEHGHTDECNEVARAAVKITKKLRIPAVEANLVNMIANVALDDNRSEEALENYQEACRLFRQLGLKTHEAITIANMGNLAWDCDRLDDAIANYKKALVAHKKDNDHRSMGIVLTDRAGVLAEQGRFDEAQRDLETALEIMQRLGHVRRVSFVRDTWAKLAEERRELEEARAHYAEAEMSFDTVGDNIQIGRMLLAMAGLQAEIGDPGGAQLLLDRAGSLDPATRSDYTPKVGDPPPRAGTAAVRLLRELATGRIELANARFTTDVATAQALRDRAAARLAAVETAPDPMTKRSSEVRRVARRLRVALAAS
ncbi:MAG: tetratricopeptide repeat protein [Kofleriaceae bacterium]